MATLETFLCGLAILAVALESRRPTGQPWCSVASRLGCSRIVSAAIEMSLSFATGPHRGRPRPLGFTNQTLKAAASARLTAAVVLFVLGARTHKPSLIDTRYAPIATKFCMAPN